MIEASLYFRDKKNPTKSEELLAAYAAAHPKDSDYVNLCLAQLAFAKEGMLSFSCLSFLCVFLFLHKLIPCVLYMQI